MATYDIDEIERAFRTYWQTGALHEDWNAWADVFTEDVVYIERVLGRKEGRDAVRQWIVPTMAEFGELYTVYEWHQVDPSGRVVLYCQNRRDHPDPAHSPIDFPGVTILQYAGDGRFSLEEDFWSLVEGQRTLKQYEEACREHDPDHPKKRTRRDWGDGPEWATAGGAATYTESVGAAHSGG